MHRMLSLACYDPVAGHGWEPASVLEHWTGPETVPSSPKCQQCRRIWRRRMHERGVSDDELMHLFDMVGAKWLWEPRESKPSEKKPVYHVRDGKIGDHIVFVDERPLTESEKAANQSVWDRREAVMAAREAAMNAGVSREEAILAYPMPEAEYVVARPAIKN